MNRSDVLGSKSPAPEPIQEALSQDELWRWREALRERNGDLWMEEHARLLEDQLDFIDGL